MLEGRPSRDIKALAEPETLYLPLRSRRFTFNQLLVNNGQHVNPGDVLARDLQNFAVPLLAPRAGTVRLKAVENHVVLENITQVEEHTHMDEQDLPDIVRKIRSAGIQRYKLFELGAWQFFYDAYTAALPDPLGIPQAVIVSTVSFEPFVARGDAQLQNRLLEFARGLVHLQTLLEYQPIYLIMPDISSAFASQVREKIRGYAWAKLVEIPLKYPCGNFNILARYLGLKKDAGPIWSVRTEGVLAIDRALTLTKPCMVRIVSVGGSAVNLPLHLKVMPGYPKQTIIDMYASAPGLRVLNGGVFTGETMGTETLGLDTECRGLTILPEPQAREMLAFMRPGWNRRSYAPCFLSSLRSKFNERLTTVLHGEGRPCVSCNFCEEVCPAGIMPHLFHKFLYNDDLDAVERFRVDLCVGCGLCSFVCPSKIELTGQLIEAQERIRSELQTEEMKI